LLARSTRPVQHGAPPRHSPARRRCEVVRLRSVAGKGTPATALLAKKKIAHELHSYDHDPRHESYGTEAAELLGLDPERVFKTLVADVDGKLTVGVVPITGQLDLKALAAAAGGKRGRMADTAAAQRTTGYVLGGISPLGHRSTLPVLIDSTAERFETIYCSAGRRGLEVELAPADLIRLTRATVAHIRA
jgi:Cys-tRNA(Pro)/Cys-tRNA(Cys) deacylase